MAESGPAYMFRKVRKCTNRKKTLFLTTELCVFQSKCILAAGWVGNSLCFGSESIGAASICCWFEGLNLCIEFSRNERTSTCRSCPGSACNERHSWRHQGSHGVGAGLLWPSRRTACSCNPASLSSSKDLVIITFFSDYLHWSVLLTRVKTTRLQIFKLLKPSSDFVLFVHICIFKVTSF